MLRDFKSLLDAVKQEKDRVAEIKKLSYVERMKKFAIENEESLTTFDELFLNAMLNGNEYFPIGSGMEDFVEYFEYKGYRIHVSENKAITVLLTSR